MTKHFFSFPTVLVTLILIGSGICDDCHKKAQAQGFAVNVTAQQPVESALAAR